MGDLSLQWNDHSSIFLGFVSSLLEKNRFSDATIACNGQLYPVHKFVLSVCSNYFNTIFEDTDAAQQHPVLILKDISQDVLEALLKYMYCGHVSIDKEKYADLSSAAKSLKIEGLDIPGSQKESGDAEKNVPNKHSSSSQEGQSSVTNENDTNQGSSSSQNYLLDSSLKENTTSLAVSEGCLISDGAQHDPSQAKRGGGKARRGQPVGRSGKRCRSQRESSPSFPTAKRSSQTPLSQPSPLPNPCATTAPSMLNLSADPGLDVASIAPVKLEMLAVVPQSHPIDAPLPVIVEIADDPSFPSMQPPAFQQQQQQTVHPEPVANSPSSSLRSFRLPGRTPGACQPLESRSQLANIRIVPEERLIDALHPKPVVPCDISSLPKIRVIPEEKLLPTKYKLNTVRIVPESRLCLPSLSDMHPGSQVPCSWEGFIGNNQIPSLSGGQPSQSWKPSPSNSSQPNLPIITSSYSVLSTSEHSPSTSEAPDQPHPPLHSILIVDPQPATFETCSQILQSQQIEQQKMEFSVGGPPCFIQPLSEVTPPDLPSSHKEKCLKMILDVNRLSPSSPIKPCSVKLTRISPNISDSLKCSFSIPCQTDFVKHTNNSCSHEEQSADLVNEQNCSGSSKYKVSASDNHSEISLSNSMSDTSATRSDENFAHTGKVYKCKLCDSEFQKINCMLEHQKSHSVSRKYFKCPDCQYLTTTSFRLQKHLTSRKPNVLIRCQYCNYTACSERLIKIHQSHVLDNNKGKELALDVPVVDAKFKKQALDSSKKKEFSCHTCHCLFATYRKLFRHELQTGHGSDKPFRCDLCEFKSVSQGAVTNHMRCHRIKATYKCVRCSYSCNDKTSLNKHIFAYHRAVDPANAGSQSIDTPLKPAVLDEPVVGSLATEYDFDEAPSNESEYSNELGLPFNVEEFQKECLNKLLAEKKTQPFSTINPGETELFSITEEQQMNISLDKPLTLETKSIETPVNSMPNLEKTSRSDDILEQSIKQVEYSSHQFKHKQESHPAGILYTQQNQENKKSTSPFILAEQKDELLDKPLSENRHSEALNKPLVQHEHDTEQQGRHLSGIDQEKEALNKPLSQHGLIELNDNLQSKNNQKIETVNTALVQHVLDDELLGRPVTENDQESEVSNKILTQHKHDVLLDQPPSENQQGRDALNITPAEHEDNNRLQESSLSKPEQEDKTLGRPLSQPENLDK